MDEILINYTGSQSVMERLCYIRNMSLYILIACIIIFSIIYSIFKFKNKKRSCWLGLLCLLTGPGTVITFFQLFESIYGSRVNDFSFLSLIGLMFLIRIIAAFFCILFKSLEELLERDIHKR